MNLNHSFFKLRALSILNIAKQSRSVKYSDLATVQCWSPLLPRPGCASSLIPLLPRPGCVSSSLIDRNLRRGRCHSFMIIILVIVIYKVVVESSAISYSEHQHTKR